MLFTISLNFEFGFSSNKISFIFNSKLLFFLHLPSLFRILIFVTLILTHLINTVHFAANFYVTSDVKSIHQHFTCAFCADILAPKITKLKCNQRKLGEALPYKKCAGKMLMKLTTDARIQILITTHAILLLCNTNLHHKHFFIYSVFNPHSIGRN